MIQVPGTRLLWVRKKIHFSDEPALSVAELTAGQPTQRVILLNGYSRSTFLNPSPHFRMITSTMVTVGTIIHKFRIILKFRASAIVKLARAILTRWFCPVYLCHICGTNLYFRHTGKIAGSYIYFILQRSDNFRVFWIFLPF